jgi:hypothetical protein
MVTGITIKVNLDDVDHCNGCPCFERLEYGAFCRMYEIHLEQGFYDTIKDVAFFKRLEQCVKENL